MKIVGCINLKKSPCGGGCCALRNAILSVTEENKTLIKSGIKYKYLVSTTYKLLCQP